MSHVLAVLEDTEHGVMYQCTACKLLCEFVHPTFGEPNALYLAGEWIPPDGPEKWMGPCVSTLTQTA